MATKSYKGVSYDTNVDYAQKIADAKASGASQSVIDNLTKQRETKIAAEGLNNDGTKKSMDYNKGNSYNNRETAYTWNDNGKNVTTFSNATNYEDARREAQAKGQLGSNANLQSAVSYQTKVGTATSSKDKSYSNSKPSTNEKTGRDAYVEALSREAGMSSSNNRNNSQTLDSYYPAMNDLYNYYMTLTPEEINALSTSKDTGRVSSEIEMALDTIRNGYTPTIVDTPQGLLPTMTAEELNQLNTAQMPVNNVVDMNGNVIANGVTGAEGYYGGINTSGNTGFEGLSGGDISSYYNDIIAQLTNNSEAQLELIRQQIEAEKNELDQGFDAQQDANYINYLRGQNALRNSLNARGITGGAADTLLVNLANNYATNQSATEQARANAINQLNQTFTEAGVGLQNELTNALATVQQNMVTAVQRAQDAETAYNQWVAEAQMAQTQADREFALAQVEMAREEYYANLDYAMKQAELEFEMQKYADKQNTSTAPTSNAMATNTVTGLSVGAPARSEYLQGVIDSYEGLAAVDEYINGKYDEAIMKGYNANQADEYVANAVKGAIKYGFINGDDYASWANIMGAAKG